MFRRNRRFRRNRQEQFKMRDTEGIFNDIIDKVSEQVARVPESARGDEMRWILVMRCGDTSANILTNAVDEKQALQILKTVVQQMAISERTPVGGKLQ